MNLVTVFLTTLVRGILLECFHRIPESRNPSEDVDVDKRIVLKLIVGSEDAEWIYLLLDTD
jgi:hypothetical protein